MVRLTLIMAAALPLWAAAQQPACGIVSPVRKIRPQDVPAEIFQSSTYNFSAAANEYESFQIICTGPLQNVSITVNPPAGIESLLHSTMYYQAVNISDCNARAGTWPDILVPAVDPWFGEARNMTTTVPSVRSRGWWVDFFVPVGTPKGSYPGTVTVQSSGAAPFTLPFTLNVWGFTLPDTSPYATMFGYDSFLPTGRNITAQQYADLGLMHRISLANVFNTALELGVNPPDWTTFQANWGKYLFGGPTPFGLKNTSMTAFQLPSPFCYNFTDDACGAPNVATTISYWSNMYNWFASRGVQSLLFDYTVDEPQWTHTWAQLRARAAAVHAANPSLRVLTTITMDIASQNNVTDLINLWVPQINNVAVKGNCYALPGNQRPLYNNVSLHNLWWYQACPSHGCGGGCTQSINEDSESPECSMGWPSYMIDHSLVMNRVHPWATYAYNFGGELYWSVTYAQAMGWDEWSYQWTAGGNGDGTMTYRGRPDKIGGTHEIPLASVRLKAIRDGQEDLLYMAAAEAVAGRAAVLEIVGSVLTSGFAIQDDPSIMAAAREALGQLAQGK